MNPRITRSVTSVANMSKGPKDYVAKITQDFESISSLERMTMAEREIEGICGVWCGVVWCGVVGVVWCGVVSKTISITTFTNHSKARLARHSKTHSCSTTHY